MNSWKTDGALAIRHNEIFVVAGRGNEGRLPFIAFPDSNEVIRAPQVQLGEDAGPTEFLESGRGQRKWVREFDRLRVECTVVNTGPQAPILLTHEALAHSALSCSAGVWSDLRK